MATLACGLINGVFCLWFDKWDSSPFSGLINGLFPSLNGLFIGLYPTNGLIIGLYPISGLVEGICPVRGFYPISDLIHLQ
jgi:hypothetical protein